MKKSINFENIPDKVVSTIMGAEEIPDLLKMKKDYRQKKHKDIRVAIDERIRNIEAKSEN